MARQLAPFDEALALALALLPRERGRLLERVAATLVDDLPDASPEGQQGRASAQGTWGASVVALLNTFDLERWEETGNDDPVRWVAERRRAEERARGLNWEHGA